MQRRTFLFSAATAALVIPTISNAQENSVVQKVDLPK